MQATVIIAASGAGTRFGGSIPKQFQLLGGEPILKRTIEIFHQLEYIGEIAVAIPPGWAAQVEGYGFAKLRHIIEGGSSRAESVHKTLTQLSLSDSQIVLIHDGVRPFVTPETIRAVAEAAAKYQAAIAAAPATDTIKQADETGKITKTLNRAELWHAQTPQGFTYGLLKTAYATAQADGILHLATDDSALVERLGVKVQLIPSPATNRKITTAADILHPTN
ncbi:MAG: 2-C-methyl-D-erythritol 4-phosphate cytidylyltransferase [Defluviitaleaceae bacterium]|nr:2-C-methyl-D-erythritol 4-phosphate cytidylyltransferase [Defluviitaleaceae bacterium]